MALNTTNWFEYPSNFSNGTAVDGLGSFVQYASTVLDGWMSLGVIILIYMATFFTSLMAGTRKALMVASFVTFPFAIYFVRLDIIHPLAIMVIIALGILGALGSAAESSSSL